MGFVGSRDLPAHPYESAGARHMVHPCIQSSITECRPGTGLIAGHGATGWMRPLRSGKLRLVDETRRAREYPNLWSRGGQGPGRPREVPGRSTRGRGLPGVVRTSRASLTFKVRTHRQEATGRGKRHHCQGGGTGRLGQ